MALTPEQLADIRTRIPARPHSDVPTPYEDLVRRIMLEREKDTLWVREELAREAR